MSLKKGDTIVTIGGIHAKILSVKENVFIIETHGGTTLKIQREAVSLSTKNNYFFLFKNVDFTRNCIMI